MPKFHVLVREVHIATMEVEAESAEDAIMAIREGDGDEIGSEYSHTLDDETWSVEDAQGIEAREQYPQGPSEVPGS